MHSRDEGLCQGKQNEPRQGSAYNPKGSPTSNFDTENNQNQRETSMSAVDLNTINQRKRDREQKEKRITKQSWDMGSHDSRKLYMRHYMQKRRENEHFRLYDNSQSVDRMRKIRSTEEGRHRNNKRSIEGMQKIRCTDEGRKNHNKIEADRMRRMLSTAEGRQKHNLRSAEERKKLLSTEEGRERLKRRSAKGIQKLLSTEEGRQKHNRRSLESMQKLLSTAEGRQKHNISSAESMQNILNTEKGRQKHNKRSVKGMKKSRCTEEGRRKHNLRSSQGMNKVLSTKVGRQKHNKRTAELMKRYRRTTAGKEKNKEMAYKGMRYLRKTKEYACKESIRRTRRKVGHSFSDAVNKFREAIDLSSSFVCSCCQQTWFKHSVQAVATLNMKALDAHLLDKCLTGYTSVGNCEWICNTCLNNLKRGKIPKLSVANGMKLIVQPAELNLNHLEERLISLRIPFMQIRALNNGGQFSLKGSVVNVPSDIEPTIQALPRLQNKSETIPVKLKRMKEFKHAVATENVRPVAVMTALQTLLRTSQLYKDANIKIDDKWTFDNREVIGDSSSSDIPASDSESDSFSEIDDDNESPIMTLLDEQTFDKNEVLSVAPGEGQKPLSIFKDPDAEYLAFPTLFCGQKRVGNSERHVPVYYSDICKWELRCVDRRVALHIPNIFFKMKKLQVEQVCSKVHLAVRRCKTKGKSYTAGYILKDNMGESLVRLDEGYRIFKTIRNSPQYWENQKREVFAMIRQLGLPTLFLSLSANDLQWSELIIALGKLVDNKDYTADLERNTLSWETRTRLVQSDPVTCVRHFDHRVSQFIETILKSPQSPLGVLQDFFYRVEFQQRGSPHIHMLAWIQEAPKYGENDDAEVIEYIDRVASCSVDVGEHLQNVLEFQKHKHSRTCRKAGKPVCRFGIPFPPMRKTTIVQPYVGEDRSLYESYFSTVQEHLCHVEQEETFDEFLENIGLNEGDYLKALQTSVTAEKVFLKRKPIECRVNPYMKDLLGVWKANHDIQYVLDAYACAMYIVSYINKSAKGMSRLMAEACKEARKGNKSLKDSVRHIGNKFLNAVEVSAQEAAYLILQLHMSTKSRKCEFVPTAPYSERTFLLKSKRDLEAMPKNSTDIEADNVIKRYARRPKALDDFCLADFISKVVSVSKIVSVSNTTSQVNNENETQYLLHDDENAEKGNVDGDRENTSKLRYSITVGDHRVVLRTKPKILRFVNYNQKVDSENYYREQIMLFLPWRNEEKDLLKNYKTYQDHFKTINEMIHLKKNGI